jgi:ACT domain-containing protein
MDLPKQFIRELFDNYLQNSFAKILPGIVKEALSHDALVKRQEFIALDEACKRYSLSRKTLYNYHKRKYITLCSSEGKTFVSIFELEAHIRKNPLPRNS